MRPSVRELLDRRHGLSRRQLATARSRLVSLGVYALIANGAVGLLWTLFPSLGIYEPAHVRTMQLGLLSVFVLVALYTGVLRWRALDDARAVNVGVLGFVLLCWAFDYLSIFTEQVRLGAWEEFGPSPILIALLPLFVPLPTRVVVAFAVAAGCGPALVLLLLDLGGVAELTREGLIITSHFRVVAGGAAVFSAATIRGYASEAERARELGAYRLTEKIGEGGMGQVWRAEHRALARNVAVKLIRAGVLRRASDRDRDALTDRFEAEARTTAQLGSPHTVDLFDFGVTEEGSFYFVMELLSGVDLERLVTETGPLPPERVAFLLVQICDSLADAHERGVIHRDVKPANVVIGPLGRYADWVKVVDFGLSGLRDELAGGDLELVGTPAFMAPEVAAGLEPTPETDVYGLGALAYCLLTGQLVFEPTDPIAQICAHLTATPTPPSEVLGRPLPANLEALVLRCLAKDPSARPASADAMAESLRATGLPELWTPARARTWWATHDLAPRTSRSPPPIERVRRQTRG
jgi:serine/threonine protein kinase